MEGLEGDIGKSFLVWGPFSVVPDCSLSHQRDHPDWTDPAEAEEKTALAAEAAAEAAEAAEVAEAAEAAEAAALLAAEAALLTVETAFLYLPHSSRPPPLEVVCQRLS